MPTSVLDPAEGPAHHSNRSAITATQALNHARDRDHELRAWVGLRPRVEVAADERSAPTGPLQGAGIGVKDLIDVRGLPTRAGSAATTPDRPAEQDAGCVTTLRAAGGVIVGKTVTTEYGYFSPGPTRNPRGLAHTPGGSSSGSAAAVASGMVTYALGTQTAGSLTRPASYCGVAGMVLAHGTVSLEGVTGLSPSLDSLGLLAPGTDELHTLWRAFAAKQTVHGRLPQHVLVWSGQELSEIAPSMSAAVDRTAHRLEALGVQVERLSMPDTLTSMSEQHALVMAYEAARHRKTLLEEPAWNRISPQLQHLLSSGREMPDSKYHSALETRHRALEQFQEILKDSVILGPGAPGPAPQGLDATGSPVLSRPWQLLGLPAVIVPVASTEDGLPLGAQIIGAAGREADLLAAGSAVQHRLHGTYS